jgi:hypothetical protein
MLPREVVFCQAGSHPPTDAGYRRHADTPREQQRSQFSLARMQTTPFGEGKIWPSPIFAWRSATSVDGTGNWY